MKTIEKESIIEFEERKSKFIGFIKPVFSKDEAENFISEIKAMHPNATHNCSAYRINTNGQEFFKFDDDGEPSGTAGKPMADIIGYMDVNNLVIVATRYFGGIKLGAGGLIRAYAKTAKLAIIEAKIIDFIEKLEILFEFPYDKVLEVEKLSRDFSVEIIEKSFLDRIVFKVRSTKEFLEIINSLDYVNIIDKK